jgi:hypothetical protein
MFSVITNIYNNNNCTQTKENWKSFFWQLEIFDVRTTGDTAHIDTIFKFQSHTSQNGSTWSLHTLVSPSDRNVNYDEKNLLGKNILNCSFQLYRFRKYVFYSFPIINFCNPGIHYETPCILLSVGPIMWEMKKYYLESRSRGISYMKYVNGRLTGLVTFCVETAF